ARRRRSARATRAGAPGLAPRRSPRVVSDDAYPPRVRGVQAEAAAGDLLHARVQAPGACLDLQAAVLDVELARARILALALGEELACAVLRSDEPERAGDENSEEEEVQFRHRASGSIRRLVGRGTAVRSATRRVALRARGFLVVSAADARSARPTIFRAGCGI